MVRGAAFHGVFNLRSESTTNYDKNHDEVFLRY